MFTRARGFFSAFRVRRRTSVDASFRTLQPPGFTPTSNYMDASKVHRRQRPVFPRANLPPLSTFVQSGNHSSWTLLIERPPHQLRFFPATLREETYKEINWNVGCPLPLSANALKSTLYIGGSPRRVKLGATISLVLLVSLVTSLKRSPIFKLAVGHEIISYRSLLILWIFSTYRSTYVDLKLSLLCWSSDADLINENRLFEHNHR